MAEWKHEIDIREAWKTDDPVTIADAVINGLKSIRNNFVNNDLLKHQCDKLIIRFYEVSKSPSVDVLDTALSHLYEWGDSSSVWIATVI